MKLISNRTQRLAAFLFILAAIIVLDIGCSSSLLNQTPVISSLTTNKDTVDSSGTAQISCDARDPDRDNLTYTWSANGGTISGQGASVTWTAPQAAGQYTIIVTVDDGKGGKATKQVTVGVVPVSAGNNSAPFIKDVTAEPYTYYDDEIATLTCIAVDPDGDPLTYTWDAKNDKGQPYGVIEGQGKVVKWTPPDVKEEHEDVTISVYVTDSVGNRSTKKFLAFSVHCACERPEVSGK